MGCGIGNAVWGGGMTITGGCWGWTLGAEDELEDELCVLWCPSTTIL